LPLSSAAKGEHLMSGGSCDNPRDTALCSVPANDVVGLVPWTFRPRLTTTCALGRCSEGSLSCLICQVTHTSKPLDTRAWRREGKLDSEPVLHFGGASPIVKLRWLAKARGSAGRHVCCAGTKCTSGNRHTCMGNAEQTAAGMVSNRRRRGELATLLLAARYRIDQV
jgi:hypothetical protein